MKKALNSHLLTTIFVTLSATLSIVVNGLIAGQFLGPDALTAYGLASPVLILLTALTGIFSNGGTIRCAMFIGRGDDGSVNNNFTVTMLISTLIAVVYSVICMAASGPLAQVLGADGAIQDMTSGYILGLGISAIPFVLLQNLILYMRMDNSQNLAMASIIVTIAVNTCCAMYSVLYTDAGLFGIGISVALGNIAGFIVTLLYFLKSNRRLKFSRPSNMKVELSEVVKSGLPTAINRGSQTLKNFSLNLFLMSLAGTTAVTALSVQTNVNQVLIAVSMGYGMMASMMCSMFYGENDRDAMAGTLRVTIKSGIIVSCIVAVITIIFAPQIVSLFIPEGDTSMAVECIRLFALSQPTSTICLVFLYYYQSVRMYTLAYVISITRGFLYVFLLSVLLAQFMGTTGVWASFFFAEALSIVTLILVVRVKIGRFPRSMYDMMLLKEDTSDTKEIFNISIRNDMNEVMTLADRIHAVCVSEGISEEKSHRLSLCIEEMAGNTVQHAFSDSKDHYMDIRILIKGDDVIFRLRDDGIPFNPIAEDHDDHYGINVVKAVAKSIDYRNNIKMNNLTVVL